MIVTYQSQSVPLSFLIEGRGEGKSMGSGLQGNSYLYSVSYPDTRVKLHYPDKRVKPPCERQKPKHLIDLDKLGKDLGP